MIPRKEARPNLGSDPGSDFPNGSLTWMVGFPAASAGHYIVPFPVLGAGHLRTLGYVDIRKGEHAAHLP